MNDEGLEVLPPLLIPSSPLLPIINFILQPSYFILHPLPLAKDSKEVEQGENPPYGT
jgi:hypothetical protein